MPRPLLCLLLLVALGNAGCGTEPPASAASSQPPAPRQVNPTSFSPATCGTLTGVVTWVGPVPEIIPLPHVTARPDGSLDSRPVVGANCPKIDRFTRGVAGVVVSLRGVDTTRARPWDLPAVTVEFRDSQIAVKQGDRIGRNGFVRCGDQVEMRSAEAQFHILRGRGAAFFAIPFPDPDKPVTRRFDTCGRVELTSAAGYFWQAADLFVCDHPYYAVTDADGRFHFTQVPEGQYDLVAWHPQWVVTQIERNPESGQIFRVAYPPPLESSRPAGVNAGRTTLANLTLPY